MTEPLMRIGTRGSPLALAQAHEARRLLAAANACEEARFEIVVIRTTGDRIQDRPLSEAGGKGLFTKEIDAAMLAGEIDAAVHSAKDLPTALPDGIVAAGYLPREDVRDAFISAQAGAIVDLPRGAILGTGKRRSKGCGPTSRLDCCAAMSRRGCARPRPVRSRRPCSPMPG